MTEASEHLRIAVNMLNDLILRDDISSEIKKVLLGVKQELLKAQDDVIWARSRAKELYRLVEELAELLGAELRRERVVDFYEEELARQLRDSLHVEAVVENEKKVKLEKMVVVKG